MCRCCTFVDESDHIHSSWTFLIICKERVHLIISNLFDIPHCFLTLLLVKSVLFQVPLAFSETPLASLFVKLSVNDKQVKDKQAGSFISEDSDSSHAQNSPVDAACLGKLKFHLSSGSVTSLAKDQHRAPRNSTLDSSAGSVTSLAKDQYQEHSVQEVAVVSPNWKDFKMKTCLDLGPATWKMDLPQFSFQNLKIFGFWPYYLLHLECILAKRFWGQWMYHLHQTLHFQWMCSKFTVTKSSVNLLLDSYNQSEKF